MYDPTLYMGAFGVAVAFLSFLFFTFLWTVFRNAKPLIDDSDLKSLKKAFPEGIISAELPEKFADPSATDTRYFTAETNQYGIAYLRHDFASNPTLVEKLQIMNKEKGSSIVLTLNEGTLERLEIVKRKVKDEVINGEMRILAGELIGQCRRLWNAAH